MGMGMGAGRLRAALAAGCVVAVMVAGAGGCSRPASRPGTLAAAPPRGAVRQVGVDTIIKVSPDGALRVNVPGVGTVAGQAGSFTRAGTITIADEQATFASSSGLAAAGMGIGITFHGTALARPLSLTFHAGARPASGALPVVAHQADDGSWDVHAAKLGAGGSITYSTSSFSINIPTWANPLDWLRGLKSMLAEAVGGRTSPLACPSSPPGWFQLNTVHTDTVHACATTNHTSDGTEVAEVQIKSNRDVSLEVTVPGSPAYVWVDGEPWAYRKALGAQLGYDPNQTVILPPGDWMSVGYPRGTSPHAESFSVSDITVKAEVDTLSRMLFDKALNFGIDQAPDLIGVGLTEVRCWADVNVGLAGGTLGANDLEKFLECWTGRVAHELSDPQNVVNVASQFGIPTGQDAARQLATRARLVADLGWLVALWPLIRAGANDDIDGISELLTHGDSARVGYEITAPAQTHVPPPPATSAAAQPVSPAPPATTPAGNPPPANPQPVNAYDNYGPANAGHAMCRGNPGRPESLPGGTASQTFTVPGEVATLSGALVQIDPDSTVTANLTVYVNGSAAASAAATASGDTSFAFGPVGVRPGDTVTISITFSATYGKIITVYTAGNPGGTFTASNSCSDGAPSLSTSATGLRAVVSGTS
jgi:protein involved in polysaccharide export with SLBB domain